MISTNALELPRLWDSWTTATDSLAQISRSFSKDSKRMDHSCVISPSQSYTATLVRLKAKFYRSKPGQNTNEIYHVMLFLCVCVWFCGLLTFLRGWNSVEFSILNALHLLRCFISGETSWNYLISCVGIHPVLLKFVLLDDFNKN